MIPTKTNFSATSVDSVKYPISTFLKTAMVIREDLALSGIMSSERADAKQAKYDMDSNIDGHYVSVKFATTRSGLS